MFDPNTWPHFGWQKNKEAYARSLDNTELWGAILDCQKAAQICTNEQSKYMDELSIYRTETERRQRKMQKMAKNSQVAKIR